jgi:hypothetical protein
MLAPGLKNTSYKFGSSFPCAIPLPARTPANDLCLWNAGKREGSHFPENIDVELFPARGHDFIGKAPPAPAFSRERIDVELF